MSGYFSPGAMLNRLFGRSPTGSEARFETRYRNTPDRQPVSTEDVESAVMERDEDPGVLSQQVEGNGLPRGGTTSWTPQDMVTSTPVTPVRDDFVNIRYPATVPIW